MSKEKPVTKDYDDTKVQFRLPPDKHDLLAMRSKEHRLSSPDKMAKLIVLNALSGKPEDLLHTALVNVHDAQSKTSKKIDLFIELFVFFVARWFASHPETPSDKRDEVATLSQARLNEFLKLFREASYAKSGSLFESLMADFIEAAEDPDDAGRE